MRQNLAFNLKAIIAQKLLPTTKDWAAATGQTRVPPVEIMRMNPTVRKLILNEEDIKLAHAIRIGKEEGMVDFTESLRQLVVAEKIERATAFENAPNPELLKMALKGITSPPDPARHLCRCLRLAADPESGTRRSRQKGQQ